MRVEIESIPLSTDLVCVVMDVKGEVHVAPWYIPDVYLNTLHPNDCTISYAVAFQEETHSQSSIVSCRVIGETPFECRVVANNH